MRYKVAVQADGCRFLLFRSSARSAREEWKIKDIDRSIVRARGGSGGTEIVAGPRKVAKAPSSAKRAATVWKRFDALEFVAVG